MLADLIDWGKLEKVVWADKEDLYSSCDSCVFGELDGSCEDFGTASLCTENGIEYIFIKKEQP